MRSVQELWWAMEPLVSFEEEEVFVTTVPSKWMETTLPWSTKTVPHESWKSCTQSSRAHLRGSMSASKSEGGPATTTKQATATEEAPATLSWEFLPHQPSSDSQPLCPLPRFAEITKTLRRKEPMQSSPIPVITSIPTKKAIDPYKVMGMAVRVTRQI